MSSFCAQRSLEHPEEQDERSRESFQGPVSIKTTILASTTGMYRLMGVLRFNSYVFIQRYSVHMSKASFSVAGTMPPEETHHQEIPKGAKATRTRGGRRFLPSSRKAIGICSKASARHQDNHQEGLHPAPTFGDTEVNIGTKTTPVQVMNFPEVQNVQGREGTYVSTCPDDGSDVGYPRPHQVSKASNR
jgi:hypothetical protein